MSHETFKAPDLEHLARLLPAFDFEAFIAQGGMGAVYKAKQRSLDRVVAIKILPRELGADPEFHQSFETEAKAMARLNHPNLISVFDFGDVDGMPYIVMEYVDGKSLYHSAWGKAVAPEQAVSLVRQICEGLGHAHENGIIHRDIKPANILLNPKAEPKIGDFGLAQPADGSGGGIVMGTPGYAAPEILQDHRTADHRADLFAVGVILHELLTGDRPDPEGKTQRRSTGDPRLDAIIRKATTAEPSLRYPSAAAMAQDLAAWKPGVASKLVTTAQPKGASLIAPPPADSTKVAARPAPAPAPVPAVANSGSSWGLARNLLIIAVLIVAIGFSAKLLKKAKEDRDVANEKQKRESFEAQKRAEAEARRKAEEARLAALNPKPDIPDPTPLPEPEPEPESPLESLERLRQALADGDRDEMPVGSKRHGNSDFLLVEKAMTWHDAAAFCEAHGGHLALPPSDSDLSWLSQLIPADSAIWIGGGRSTADNWFMTDGSDWPLEKKPAGAGDFAALDDLGLVRARPFELTLPFVIQWQRDGSNEATLAAMLRRTRMTLDSPTPVFPPGTKSYDGRHFCVIARALNRDDASRLAEQAGGTLATLATENELYWLKNQITPIPAENGLWLGGTKNEQTWSWDSREPWTKADWAKSADPVDGHTALAIVPNMGWVDADPEEPTSGFIIEWSKDADATPADAEDIGTGIDLASLQKRATELVENARTERDKKLAENSRKLLWDINVWFRGVNASGKVSWEPHVEALIDLVESSRDSRVPGPDDFENGDAEDISLSEPMAKACEYAFRKQQEIDAAYGEQLNRLRNLYLTKLRETGKAAADAGQSAVAAAIRETMEESADIAGWLESLGLKDDTVDPPKRRTANFTTREAGPGFVGEWIWNSLPGVVWSARENGRITCDAWGLEGTWKKSGPGVTVDMGTRGNADLVWEDNAWRGRNERGLEIILRRAD